MKPNPPAILLCVTVALTAVLVYYAYRDGPLAERQQLVTAPATARPLLVDRSRRGPAPTEAHAAETHSPAIPGSNDPGVAIAPADPGQTSTNKEPVSNAALNQSIEAQIEAHYRIAAAYPPLAAEPTPLRELVEEMEPAYGESYDGLMAAMQELPPDLDLPAEPPMDDELFTPPTNDDDLTYEDGEQAREFGETADAHVRVADKFPPLKAQRVDIETLRLEMEQATQR